MNVPRAASKSHEGTDSKVIYQRAIDLHQLPDMSLDQIDANMLNHSANEEVDQNVLKMPESAQVSKQFNSRIPQPFTKNIDKVANVSKFMDKKAPSRKSNASAERLPKKQEKSQQDFAKNATMRDRSSSKQRTNAQDRPSSQNQKPR